MTVLLFFIAVPLFVLAAFLLATCLASLLPRPDTDEAGQVNGTGQDNASSNDASDDDAFMPRTVIVIPAHNEAGVLGKTLATLAPQLSPKVTALVVADNCTDTTADEAHSAGPDITVIERNDPGNRGKGHALSFALAHLDGLEVESKPEVVVVLDADCTVEGRTLGQLAELAWDKKRPVQADYLLTPPTNPSPKTWSAPWRC